MPAPFHAKLDVVLFPARFVQDLPDVITKISLDFEHQRRRPLLRIGRLPAEKLPGKRVHASAGFPRPHGSEDRHSGIQSALRDGEPRGVENLPRFDRVMDLSDHDSRSLLIRRKRPRGKPAKSGEIAPARFKPDLPDGHGKQTREHDGDKRRGVVPQHHPLVESGGVIVHQIEQGTFAKGREGTPEKVPDGIP